MSDLHLIEQSATSSRCKCGAPIADGATRCPRGHVRPLVGVPGAALKHGAHSMLVKKALLPEQAARRAALVGKGKAIEADLGGEANLSVIKSDLVRRYLETDLLAEHLAGQLIDAGLFTPKGRMRASFTAYLQVLDRLHRLATALGLERRTKSVPNPLDYIEGR